MALAGLDPLAVDAICAHLMGFDPWEIGYLVHAARLGLGEIDLKRIEVVGAALAGARKSYRPHRTHREQLNWSLSPELEELLWR